HWPEVLDSSVLESLLKGPSRLLRDVYKCLTAESSHQGADLQGTQACTEHQVRPILSLSLSFSLSLSLSLSLTHTKTHTQTNTHAHTHTHTHTNRLHRNTHNLCQYV